MAIFNHTDCDGDSMEILAEDGEDMVVLFFNQDGWRAGGIRLDPVAEERLYAVLAERLGERDDNLGPEPIYTALVRRLVAEEVARVLPLHQSPQATVRCAGTACCEPHPLDPQASVPEPDAEYGWLNGPDFCTIQGCDRFPKLGYHLEHDPEPQEVGHPVKPHTPSVHLTTEDDCKAAHCAAARHLSERPTVDWSDKLFGKAEYAPGLSFDYCTSCGHGWSSHGFDDRQVAGCTAQLGKNRCGCTRMRGETGGVEQPAGTELCRCGDLLGVHGLGGACTAEGCKCGAAVPRSTS